MTEPGRLDLAFATIDEANAADPATIEIDGDTRPKELTHAAMAVDWVRRLVEEPSEALLLAARAHHIRRWEIPRSSEPEGRAGYLRWKRRLQAHHADVAGSVLSRAGVDGRTIERVQQIIRKQNLRTDPEVQTLEDALCLVFVQTQFAELSERLETEHMVDVVAKTLAKMTPKARQAALDLDLTPEARDIIAAALAQA